MKTILLFLIITSFCTTEAKTQTSDNNIELKNQPEGAINGIFSISPTKKVYFSKGNLQFCRNKGSHMTADNKLLKGTWRFAENQYDYIGIINDISRREIFEIVENDYYKEIYNKEGYFDSFGWATSGYDNTKNDKQAIHFHPWSPCFFVKKIKTRNIEYEDTTTVVYNRIYNNDGFGPTPREKVNNNLTYNNRYYDWGVYNAISNGGDKPGLWRTLTADEFLYLTWQRPNAQELITIGIVNGQFGLILMPDNWVRHDSIKIVPFADVKYNKISFSDSFDTIDKFEIYDFSEIKDVFSGENVYSKEQWTELESLGCVFLPGNGSYWTSTSYDNGFALTSYWFYCMSVKRSKIKTDNYTLMYNTLGSQQKTTKTSVRLVFDYK
ncbi:MAG: hypothetical protein J6Y82_01170 [Bacteroidales bacterium]|nr:hypothetical protein [Bacteroidales bacterium]